MSFRKASMNRAETNLSSGADTFPQLVAAGVVEARRCEAIVRLTVAE
jgi:hypothetical protein